jgi:hypothetical protein
MKKYLPIIPGIIVLYLFIVEGWFKIQFILEGSTLLVLLVGLLIISASSYTIFRLWKERDRKKSTRILFIIAQVFFLYFGLTIINEKCSFDSLKRDFAILTFTDKTLSASEKALVDSFLVGQYNASSSSIRIGDAWYSQSVVINISHKDGDLFYQATEDLQFLVDGNLLPEHKTQKLEGKILLTKCIDENFKSAVKVRFENSVNAFNLSDTASGGNTFNALFDRMKREKKYQATKNVNYEDDEEKYEYATKFYYIWLNTVSRNEVFSLNKLIAKVPRVKIEAVTDTLLTEDLMSLEDSILLNENNTDN